MDTEVEIVKPKNAKEWLNNLWRVLGAHIHWLWDACPALVVVAVSLICCMWIWLDGFSEHSFRLAGLTLQLVGVIEVMASIWKARKSFLDRPEVFTWKRWLSRRPSYCPRHFRLQVQDAAHVAVEEGNLDIRIDSEATTMEERIEALKVQLKWLREDLDRFKGQTCRNLSELKADLSREREELTVAVARVDLAVGKLELSGLHWAEAGAVSLLIGLILATGSQEWHCLFA